MPRATTFRAPWQLPLALVAVAAAVLQRSVLRAPFFADDFLFLQQVRNQSLIGALTSRDPIGNFVRPVGRQLHFWWLAAASGESPVAFHAANLILFVIAIGLLFGLARRLAGTAAATWGAAFLALHYAADVPLQWASGSQDLLALVGALGAVWLAVEDRPWWAATALLGGLLSKETVALTPLIALLAARRPSEPWRASLRRVALLVGSVLVAGLLWLTLAARHQAAASALKPGIASFPAAFVHLVQVAAGAEWRSGRGWGALGSAVPWIPLVLCAGAVWFARAGVRKGRSAAATESPGPERVGLAWGLLGALPVMVVAPIWSAYYYLFALCGVALALGAWVSRRSLTVAVALLVLLAWGSGSARRLDEFATRSSPWTPQSHVNRFYLDRAMNRVARYLRELRQARPELPANSTIFFTSLPAFIGLQTADGPVVRWAYRDSSLRSYYLFEFTAARFRRGPAFFFSAVSDTLREEPMSRRLLRDVAFNTLLNDQPNIAEEALEVALEADSTDATNHYWMAWMKLSAADTAAARRELVRAGVQLEPGRPAQIDAALSRVAAGDTMSAVRIMAGGVSSHGLDPEAHATFADLLVNAPSNLETAVIETYAARVLAPNDPRSWWRWAFIQNKANRFSQAVPSLEHYLSMPGRNPTDEAQAKSLLAELKRMQPGGDLAQGELRRGVGTEHGGR